MNNPNCLRFERLEVPLEYIAIYGAGLTTMTEMLLQRRESGNFASRVYPVTKLLKVVEAVYAAGGSYEDALRDTGMAAADLGSPTTRVSIDQMLTIYRNAIGLSRGAADFAMRTGLSVHPTVYGMYGFAILSSICFRNTVSFATKYHDLADPLVHLTFEETDTAGIWRFIPLAHPAVNADLFRFIVELQFGIVLSLQRDLMGPDFRPAECRFTFEDDPRLDYRSMLGSTVSFGQPTNELIFDRNWLDKTPEYGNGPSYAVTLKMCDELLEDLESRKGAAGQVRRVLLANLGRSMSSDLVAVRLGITTRTLRRKLREEGLTFRQITDNLRTRLAEKYLRETDMTVEDIAAALSFSDAANFRHAFRRWKGQSPQQFRLTAAPD